jgi:NAD(P)-dependent dehydrogenase (short-subunit alcohol dehydrogenase family)
MQADLAGQIAIVTGPAQSIGKAIALSLAQRGADLVLVGRRLEAMEPVAEVVRGGGRRAHLIRCDVTQGDQVRAMVAEAAAEFNDRIDILVNTAGGTGSLGVPIWEISEQSFAEIMTLNLTSCFLTMAAVLPWMIARRSGRIVSIGGTFGLRGRAGRAAYSAAKWGLRGLTRSAALDAGPYNVTVNCVCPGMVEGPRFDEASEEVAARDGIPAAEARTRIAEGYPLRRISTPQDIANMVMFLAGEGGRQITGQDLAVDGGWSV